MSKVLVEAAGAVRTITLNRPEKRNALDAEMLAELVAAFHAEPPPEQRLTVLPNLSNSGEWRASWNGGIAVAMTNVLSLTVGLTVAYNSEPGPGRKKTDTLFTTGLSVRFD